MKTPRYWVLAFAAWAWLASCGDAGIEGCTDPAAFNYTEDASSDDGSCCYSCFLDCPSELRTGALCNDGTTSGATGGGACSNHGGVECWFCECN